MTELNSTINESLAQIGTINAEIKRLTEVAKNARTAAMEPFLDALAASGKVSLIVVYGSTPGFNDGEPCTHSADLIVNIEDFADYDFDGLDLPGELIDLPYYRNWNGASREYEIDQSALDANIELCRKHGHVYQRPSDEIMSAINQVVFDTIEEEQDTNYFVAFVLKNGKFERIEGEYDCGY